MMKVDSGLFGFVGKYLSAAHGVDIERVDFAVFGNVLEDFGLEDKVPVAANAVNDALAVLVGLGDPMGITRPLAAVSELAQTKLVGAGKLWFKVLRPEMIGIPREAFEVRFIAVIVVGLGELESLLVSLPCGFRNVGEKSEGFGPCQLEGFLAAPSPQDLVFHGQEHAFTLLYHTVIGEILNGKDYHKHASQRKEKNYVDNR
mmetsp:Transcript_29022/g.68204  ORF Transcript_29022/g.68204 Transcript_29022/m.68204 type:complete len:202 (-) Transcript_29022:231-836(-)